MTNEAMGEHSTGSAYGAARTARENADAELADRVLRRMSQIDPRLAHLQPEAAVSRQARHAQRARARTTIAAGAVLMAVEDPELRRFVLSLDFVPYRPYSADAFSKWRYVLAAVAAADRSGYVRLFEDGANLFLALGARVQSLPGLEPLRILNAVCAATAGAILFPDDFRGPVAELTRDARRLGILDNPLLRARLALLSAWAGDHTDLLDMLLDPDVTEMGLADGYLFVRRDVRPELFSASCEFLRQGTIDPERCMLSSNPGATIVQMLDYALNRLRDPLMLRGAGHMLLLLTAAAQTAQHARAMHERGLLRDGLDGVRLRLARVERVQVMEKRRYFTLLESLPDSPVRERLRTLWEKSLLSEL